MNSGRVVPCLSLYIVLFVIVPIGGGSPRGRVSDRWGELAFHGAGEAEEHAPEEQESGSRPAHVQGSPHFPLLGGWDVGVVELPDDDVGCPAEGNEDQEAGQDEDDSSSEQYSALHLAALVADRALSSNHGHQKSDQAHDGCHDRESSASLELLGQG